MIAQGTAAEQAAWLQVPSFVQLKDDAAPPAQEDYEALMGDSQKSRAQNVESITSKEAAKGDLDMKIENAKENLATQGSELLNINSYIAQLHGSCDFLIDNYDLRKQARANEVEGLKNAKGVLSGASFA